MYEKEEQRLDDYKKKFDHLDLPLERIDDAIATGFHKAKAERKKGKQGLKKWLVSFAVAAVLLLGFITSIRVSPAFADYITSIPGMDKIVDLIRNDKGRMQAIQNDYYEELDVTQEKDGITFSIDGAIADESGLVLFYTVKSDKKQKHLEVEEARLEGAKGEDLNIGSASYGAPLYSDEGKTTHNDYLEYFFQTPLEARKYNLYVRIKAGKQIEEYHLSFELKKDFQKVKTYPLNQTAAIEGQKITVVDAKVYPLRVAIHVKMDKANTKKLLSFDDIRLVDEKGETWNKIANGITASLFSDDEAILYLQSNYFRQPKELYLAMNKIQAVDKDETRVVLDIEKEQIVSQPKGDYISDFHVVDNNLLLTLSTKQPFHSFIFSGIRTGDGKELQPEQTSTTYKGENDTLVEYEILIPNLKSQQNPISLEITAFPTWINGDYKIRIK